VSYSTDHLHASEREAIARSCFQVTEHRGNELHGLCPFHGEKKASFSYNYEKDLCHCLSCGASGDLIKLWGEAHGYGDNDTAFKAFAREYGSDTSGDFCPAGGKKAGACAPGGPGEGANFTKIIPEADFEELQPLSKQWQQRCAEMWGWSPSVIKQLRLKPGDPERLAIPIRQDDGSLVNIRLYAPGAKDFKVISWGKGFGKSKLFPNPGKWKKTKPIILCEGEKDCLTALSKGFNAVTQTAGCNSWADQFTRFFRNRKVIIAYDADEKGRNGAQKVAQKLAGTAKEVRIITWPDEIMPMVEDHGQDLTDYFNDHGKTPQDFKNLIVKTVPEQAKRAPGDTGDDDVRRFFGGTRGTQFKPRLVCDEIMEWRQLIHDPKSGMIHTWTDTHWQEYHESNIRRRILDMLKIEGTTSRCTDVLGLVRDLSIMHHGRQMNDQQNKIPILNGMFDLESGDIGEHNPDNLNSYIIDLRLDIDRLPSCHRWQQFLVESINDGDTDTIREIQKFFGYCLTRETRHEKALILVGPGGDGKGTILKILQALVGDINTSSVTIGGLQDQFHRVMLVDKLLNVATEVEGGLLQSDIFKTITSGESVTAAYKHKDAFSFFPVCKLAFSANKYPNIQDTSDGLYRRLLVIEMKQQFVKQGKADLYLFDKLLDERAGIFMWALKGLQLLKEENFTPSCFMEQCLEKFQEINDPVLAFVLEKTEVDSDGWIQGKDIYKAYVRFCKVNGYYSKGKGKFLLDFLRHYPELKEERKSKTDRRRGYQGLRILLDEEDF